MFSCELLYMNVLVQDNQQGLTYFSSALTLDAVSRIFQDQWLWELNGQRVSENFILWAEFDYDTFFILRLFAQLYIKYSYLRKIIYTSFSGFDYSYKILIIFKYIYRIHD